MTGIDAAGFSLTIIPLVMRGHFSKIRPVWIRTSRRKSLSCPDASQSEASVPTRATDDGDSLRKYALCGRRDATLRQRFPRPFACCYRSSSEKSQMRRKLLLVSHDGSRTGAPIALLQWLEWMRDN